jgi:hypothetical protein
VAASGNRAVRMRGFYGLAFTGIEQPSATARSEATR